MSLQSRKCNRAPISELVAGHLSEEDEAALAEHLSTCEPCRDALRDASADQDVWDKAGQYLRDENDELCPLSSSRDVEAGELTGRNTIIDLVLDSLAPTDDPEMLGRIGDYEISGVIGCGGMGAVLKGYDRSLKRVVAVKVMAPHLASSGAARKRFAREAQAAAAMTHDNVIDIYGVSEANGLPYLVMPYSRGTSLQKRIDDRGPLSVVEVLRIGSQIAAGLAAAHEQGLVHRDIKPANILLSDGVERLVITDFGLARAVDDASVTRTGVIAGTPQYMSPEQARGESVDHRSDLFSLGSVLYTLCTGRPPFRAEGAYGILRRITDNEPRPIREINPDVPEWLCAIIAKLLAKRPADRFASAADVAELLEECLAHVQQPTAVPLPWRKLPACEPTPRQAGSLPHWPARIPPAIRLIGLAMFALPLLFAGILIVLELNKGTLRIECEVDDVPIRIMQGDDVVERLTITRAGECVRIAAGEYVVTVDGGSDEIFVQDGAVTLKRGDTETVRIVRSRDSNAVAAAAEIDTNLAASASARNMSVKYRVVFVPDGIEQRIESSKGLSEQDRAVTLEFFKGAFRSNGSVSDRGTKQAHIPTDRGIASAVIDRLVAMRLVRLCDEITAAAGESFGDLTLRRQLFEGEADKTRWEVRALEERDGELGIQLKRLTEPAAGETNDDRQDAGVVIRFSPKQTAIMPWYFHFIEEDARTASRTRWHGEHFLLIDSASGDAKTNSTERHDTAESATPPVSLTPAVQAIVAKLDATNAAIRNLSVTTDYVKREAYLLPFDSPIEMKFTTQATIASDGRSRVDTSGQQLNIEPDGKSIRTYNGRWVGVFNDGVARSLTYYEGNLSSASIDNVMSWHGLDPREFTTHFQRNPIPEIIRTRGAEIGERTEWDGRPVTVVETTPRGNGEEKRRYRFWIDTERGIVVRRAITVRFKEGQPWQVYSRIESRDHREIAPGIWLPMQVKYESFEVTPDLAPEKLSWSYEGVNRDWKLNENLPDDTFELEFPQGTRVSDHRPPKVDAAPWIDSGERAAAWGHLKGRFVLDGERPKTRTLGVSTDQATFGDSVVDESLMVDANTNGIANVLLFVRTTGLRVHPDYAAGAKEPQMLTFADGYLRPRVAALRVGQPLVLQNADDVGHNPTIDTLLNPPHNALLPSKGRVEYSFASRESRPVPVSGRIHPWLRGWLMIADHPYMTVTDKDGAFELRNLPTGELEFQCWHERTGWLAAKPEWERGRFRVTLDADAMHDLGTIKVPAMLLNGDRGGNGSKEPAPDAVESVAKTMRVEIDLPHQFRLHWPGAVERSPTTARFAVPANRPSHIRLDEIIGHHGLEIGVTIEPTDYASSAEFLKPDQRMRIKISEEELAALKANKLWTLTYEQEQGTVVAVIKFTARQRPVTPIADIKELDGTWRLVEANIVSGRRFNLRNYKSARIVINDNVWKYSRERIPSRAMEATYDLNASPQTVDLKYSVRGAEKHERRLLELHGDTLITARRVGGSPDYPASYDELMVLVEQYQRVGVVTDLSGVAQAMVAISLGTADGIRLNQQLQVSDGSSVLGTVEVTTIGEYASNARVVEWTGERPVRKGDRVSPVKPRDRESVPATNNADDRVMQGTRTVSGTVHSASRSREDRWEIRYPSEPRRFAAAIDFCGVELGVADLGSQQITYLSGVSATSPTVRRGPAVSETRLYLTMADADSIRIAKSLLEQAGIETRDRVVLWFHSPWAERTLASLEANAADARSVDLVDKTVFGVHAQGEKFEFYVISQDANPSTTGSSVEPRDSVPLRTRRGAAASEPIHEKLAEIRNQAHAGLTSIKTLQYRFEQKDDEGWHAMAEFYGDQKRFRVNREDITGMMAIDASLKPVRSKPMKIASAFDGQRQQYMDVINGNESLRVKAGRAGASYGIYTPQLWTYLWLRQGPGEFHWDTILSADLWEQRFKDATYIGDITEDGRRFEIVDFPQRSGRVACIYRVYFARDLGFLPLKYFRNTLAKNELSTTMEVTRFKTLAVDGRQIAIPLEVRHQETQADGVSKKGESTTTVDEDSLKVNEPLDDALFNLSRAEDAAEREMIP